MAPCPWPDTDDAADREALNWLIALTEAPGDAALRARFEAWRRQSPRHEAAWREATLLDGLVVEAAPATTRRKTRQPARLAAALALAACLVLALLPTLRRHWQADYQTGTGENLKVTLADGSVAHLGADSAIATADAPSGRTVTLIRGEAFFEVVHDPAHPFTVTAGKVSTTVLGTAFDVERAGDGAVVSVREGRVRVASGEQSQAAVLIAGQWLRMGDDGAIAGQGTTSPDLVAAWRQGQLAVKDSSVADAIAVVRRHYQGLIVLRGDGLADKRITGLYDLSDPAEALAAMTAPQGARVIRLTPWLLVISPG